MAQISYDFKLFNLFLYLHYPWTQVLIALDMPFRKCYPSIRR